MVGLTRKKSKYYVQLRNKYPDLPIYTLRLPGARLYIINSATLIPAVQRHFKELAFPPLEVKFASNICGSSKAANEILTRNVNGEEGDWGYSMTFYKAIHTPLAPGPGLDAMNRIMAERVVASIDGMKDRKRAKLFNFVKHEITLATTESVYGPQNPFRDRAVEESFWKFQPGIMILLMNLFPSVLAKESLEARELLVAAFNQYLKNDGPSQGSALMKARYDHSMEHKIPMDDIARFEVGNTIGILTNTAPAAFWMAYHLYSDAAVLRDCRDELAHVVSDQETTTPHGQPVTVRTIDLARVKTSCPLLLSTLQEVLRVHSVGISTRLVMQDHVLAGQYLLKKGNTVMIPGPVQHTNAGTWGPDVHRFDHRRFLPKTKRHNAVAFRGFGGGTTLCPGRHFASTEILAFTALMILRFDVAPVDGAQWTCPTTAKAEMWEVTPMPDEDIDVEIRSRAGGEEEGEKRVKWRVVVTDSDKAMPLAAEDE
ncbi:putative 25-hydroxycholesterol 7-alpha-hydroxylase [Massariosphaeria phaeospora]|uniref:Putative 25-hydroxycholesterol 7-alpha-hydroxylase n=1 Tax=Massariosphaeria phaeospora TaxID=100035 RepID=A0A7C8I6P4_9PLEO|nr:putative 25-hydroxycholesterol 7-alpha-hydroxylase [Massariosphaeria phaeospora]